MPYLLIFLCFIISLSSQEYVPYFPDYDLALTRYGNHNLWFLDRFNKTSPKDIQTYFWNLKFQNLSQRLYNRNQLGITNIEKLIRIPKIIHQIWLGSPVPENYKVWMESWINLKGWEYRLWTDVDIDSFNIENRSVFDSAKNYGEQANVLRYEILHRFGGLYVDVDMECLTPQFFEYAHFHYDFYVGLEPLDHGFVVCNAVIGAIPKHPLLTKMIHEMQAHVASIPKEKQFTTINNTGPKYLSQKMLEYGARNTTIDVILPATFFYPFSLREVRSQGLQSQNYIFSETVALHWWDASWLKPEARLLPSNTQIPKDN